MESNFYLKQQQLLAQNKWYRRFWDFLGLYGVLIYFVLAAIFLFQPHGLKIIFLALLAGLITRYVVCELLVLLYKKSHPYQRLNFKAQTSWFFSLQDGRHDAFPSQHTATAAAFAGVFYLFSPLLGAVALAGALVVGIARIVLGYHDFWDVLAGLIIGFAGGIFIAQSLYFGLFTR